jgi:hypothetical protein
VPGCKNPSAKNYDPQATHDDGSCLNYCGCKLGSRNQDGTYVYEYTCRTNEDGLNVGSCPGGLGTNEIQPCCDFGKTPCANIAGCTQEDNPYNYCDCVPTGCPSDAPDLLFDVAVGSCNYNQERSVSCSNLYTAYSTAEPEPFEWSSINLYNLLGGGDICYAKTKNSSLDLKYPYNYLSLGPQMTSESTEGCVSCVVDGSDPANIVYDSACLSLKVEYSDSQPTEYSYYDFRCCGDSSQVSAVLVEEISEGVFKTTTIYTVIRQTSLATYSCGGSTILTVDCDGCRTT